MAGITYGELKKMAYRRGKVSDATAKEGIGQDLNVAQKIVSTLRNWPELLKKTNLTLSAGDDSYNLNTNSDTTDDIESIQQILIISPTGNEKEVKFIEKTELRRFDPVTSNSGTGTPDYWYWHEPVVLGGIEERQIGFYPVPDQEYTAQVSFKRNVSDMVNEGDYPFFNINYHHILIDYALWKEAETNPDSAKNPNYWKEEWHGPLFPNIIGGGLGQLLAFTAQTQNQVPPTIPGPDRF